MIKSIATIAAACGLLFPAIARADDSVAAQIKAIDTECSAISQAVMALKPIHVINQTGTWKVVSEGDYTVAEHTHAQIMFVDAWKQGANYAWVHSHTFTASGDQRATELCFRQSDGTLERARQAATVNDLAGSATAAYYASDGSILEKASVFEVNDPAIAKKIADLPYYNLLP